MTLRNDDKALAEELAKGEKRAQEELLARYGPILQEGFAGFQASTPASTLQIGDLIPAVAAAVGKGFLNLSEKRPTPLDDYAELLNLSDLFLAAACLCEDEEAWAWLQQTAENDVLPALQKSCGHIAGSDKIDNIVRELVGNFYTDVTDKDKSRPPSLATYQGRASIRSWLYAVARNDLRHVLSSASQTRSLSEAQKASVSSGEDTAHREIAEVAGTYRRRLASALKNSLDQMPDRRRIAAILHWIHGRRPAQIAAVMSVSRPRVTELLGQARRDLGNSARTVCEDIAAETNRDPCDIEDLLHEEIAYLTRDSVQLHAIGGA